MSVDEETRTTKEKILIAANELFAKNGFSGASIREIATMANVNLAAINYHFKNKENLYWHVFDYNYHWIKNGIAEIGKQDLSTPELAVEVFRFFTSRGSAVMNTFKIFLSENVELLDEDDGSDDEGHFGPPGEEVFLEKIERDLGPGFSDQGKRWAMKMTFSLLVHFGVIMNTKIMKKKCKNEEELKQEFIEESLRQAVLAHLNHLRNYPNLFRS